MHKNIFEFSLETEIFLGSPEPKKVSLENVCLPVTSSSDKTTSDETYFDQICIQACGLGHHNIMYEKLFGKNNSYCCQEIPTDFLINKLKLKSVFRHPTRKLTSIMSVYLTCRMQKSVRKDHTTIGTIMLI